MGYFFFFFVGAGNDQNARAGSRAGSGEVWRVWTVDMKEGGGGGGEERGNREGETGRGQWGGGGGQ